MAPTPEGTARAKKAWETIRRKQEQKQARLSAAPGAAERVSEIREPRIGLERDLQAALRQSIEQIEPGLVVIDGGKERVGPSGRIDILATDANKKNVVIELKVGEADRDAIAQLLSYMGDLQAETADLVRGMVIAHDFTARAVAASKPVPNVELRKYKFNFSFERL